MCHRQEQPGFRAHKKSGLESQIKEVIRLPKIATVIKEDKTARESLQRMKATGVKAELSGRRDIRE